MGRDSLVATAAYQPEPEAAAAARHFVRETLRAWQGSGHCAGQDDLVDDAVLLTSELVTNAVVHAGTSVQVMCRLADESVEIAVVDHRPVRLIPDEPLDAAIQPERTNGRGLLLPAKLAAAWGVTYARTCKAVWFRLGVRDAATSGTARHGALSGAAGEGGAANGTAGHAVVGHGLEWARLDEPEPRRQERSQFTAADRGSLPACR